MLSDFPKGKRFFIVAGGGVTCRNYITAADKIVKVKDDDRDWLGIHSTRLNAHLLRTIFCDIAHPEIIKNPTIHMKGKEKIFIAGGWKPGWSTDYVATMIAQEYDIKTVLNLSDIDYVYDDDPKKNKKAKPIDKINWTDFRELIGDEWGPGFRAPFDPVASHKGQELGLKVIIMKGNNLDNLKKYLNDKEFKGTVISK